MSVFPALLKQPQRRIHPAFRDQIRITMRDKISQTQLALMVGIPQQSGLSTLLRMPFPASPLTISRLEKLAAIVGYTGEILRTISIWPVVTTTNGAAWSSGS